MTQQPLLPSETYCCDLDALIQLHAAKRFGRLRKLAQGGRLEIAEGIFREARRRHQVIFRSLQQWNTKYGVVAMLNKDQAAKDLLPDMETKYGPVFHVGGVTYPGFWASGRGRKTADGQLVAFARANGWVVISNDVSVHGACLLENVECRRWEYLAR